MMSLRIFKQMDYLLLAVMLLLLVGGWFIMYSASYQESLSTGINYSYKQIIWIGIALVVFVIILFIDYRFLLRYSFVIYGLILILLLLVLFKGQARFGARRWLGWGGITIQPSELAKIGILLAITRYLVMDIERRETFRYILITGLLLAVPLFLIFKQPDLGTAVIFVPTVLVMLFVAGIRWRYVLIGGAAAMASAPFLWTLLKDYQKNRILSFLHPESDPFGAGYSIIQSKIAIGSGGVLGKGWLGGTQNRLNFIPERHTDFIFSVIGEEWGFAGAIIILILFFIVIAAGFGIARKAPDTGGRILATGIITLFSVQAIVNVAMTIGLVPITGLTLPFISYGGTSIVVTVAMIGLLQNIYMRRFMF